MKKYILITVSLICWFLLPVMVQAQDAKVNPVVAPASIELTQAKSLWFNTNNAAGLAINPLTDFSEVSAKYISGNGGFKFQQQGTKEKDMQFNANGALKLSGISLWGNFTFSNITTKDSRFNTMLYEPFRQMPFFVADPVSSEWKKQLYDLRLKVATPLFWDRLALGAELDYTSKTGAKQNDPRSTSYYYSISARPGFIFKLNDNNFIGANGVYENMFERTIPTNSNSQQDQQVYIMRGLGNYYSGMIGGLGGLGTFYYKSDKLGAAFQYGYHGNFSLLLDLKYHYKVEDAFQSPSKPQRMGSTVQTFKNANLQFINNGSFSNKITVDYYEKETDGIEYIQILDKSYDIQQWVVIQKFVRSNYAFKGASLKYDLFNGNERGYSWRAGLSGEYSDMADIYYLPESKFEAENLFGSVYAKKNFKLGDNSSFLFGLNLGYNKNLGGQFDYNGADPNSIVIKELYEKDFTYLTSEYYRMGLGFTYSIVVGKSSNTLFASGDLQLLRPRSGADIRNNGVFSLGFTF